jgi:uncharacterized protein YutE (UPF0331/DUF86 family)
MLKREIVEKHLRDMDEWVRILRRHQNISLAKLKQDVELQLTLEHAFQLTIQNAIDIASHIVASLAVNEVEDYASTMQRLGQLEVVPETFVPKLVQMVGFRNVLVHVYMDVSIEKVHKYLQELDDFDRFAFHITEYLETQ